MRSPLLSCRAGYARLTYRRGAVAVLGLTVASVGGCRNASYPGLDSTLWVQTAAEYRGSTIQSYRTARRMLDVALADKQWTATPAEQTGDYSELPAAVILDIDGTVLDSSPQAAWLVEAGREFGRGSWARWCEEARAELIPGAGEFIDYAESKGVKVFYVTNRDVSLEALTRRNLESQLHKLDTSRDTVLMREEYGAARNKGPRRAEVAKDYRILLLIGDNLGDFVDDCQDTPAERFVLVEKHAEKWGRQWIVIPNPMYGSWEGALYGFGRNLPARVKQARKLQALEVWKPETSGRD